MDGNGLESGRTKNLVKRTAPGNENWSSLPGEEVVLSSHTSPKHTTPVEVPPAHVAAVGCLTAWLHTAGLQGHVGEQAKQVCSDDSRLLATWLCVIFARRTAVPPAEVQEVVLPVVTVAVAEPPSVMFALTRVLFRSAPEVYTVQLDE